MKKILLFIILIIISSCKSTKLVDSYKNPENVVFTAYKVLLVGMTPNQETRVAFESLLKEEFDKRKIESMRSIDLFDVNFTASAKTEEELRAVERQLLDKDFDAVLFAKVLGSESKQTVRKKISDWGNYTGKFRDDYLQHQDIYNSTGYYDQFKVYHTETTLYCICEGKEQSMVWRGSIDLTDPKNIDKSIDEYVQLVVNAMQEQDVIFRKK
ncbi:hypothetical protein Celal_1831 [Cellulophaga algicola DSM 14237]|uniref:Cardiolipin synthetase n=1 Tax=Cellulophaga algicola (strain DSM 14237 / IC166 / ACAM 630) TaxID=688270 RepID=E6XE51_CELAD|nr:cardiolipin synthetase [Cellulophaga algicola]ADV49132.1 hypothetical protein Celal_1831 [Cellulophaga algicola DSM 14237]